MLHDLRLFVWLVASGWEQYAEAGMTGLLIYLGERLLKKPFSWNVLKWAATAFLLFAFFNVWRNQYHESDSLLNQVENLQNSLNAINKPIISASVEGLALAPSGEKGESCVITEFLHIKNLGAQTALEKFRLQVTTGKGTYYGRFVPPVDGTLGYGFSPKDGGTPLRATDNIFIRATRNPIMTNVPADVWFQALINGVSRDEMAKQGNKITLSFYDVASGATHTVESTTSGNSIPPLDLNELYKESRR